MTEVVLVSCSKSKRDEPARAGALYEPSAIFRKRRRVAHQRGDQWGMLSAKYGYLRPWEVTSPYEKHITERTAVWAGFVLRDLLRDLRFYDARQVTILAGSKYVDPLVTPLEARGYDVVDLHRGLRPGERMHALDEAVEPGEQATLSEVSGSAD